MTKPKIKIVFKDTDHDGYYVPNLNMIVVKKSLGVNARRYVIMHELAHIPQSSELYFATSNGQIKLEYEANKTMVEGMLSDYLLSNDHQPVNYVDFMEQTGLSGSYEHVVKEVLSEKGEK